MPKFGLGSEDRKALRIVSEVREVLQFVKCVFLFFFFLVAIAWFFFVSAVHPVHP